MPTLDDDSMATYGVTGSHFTFQATRIEDLGATEYTLVTIAVDVTGSVYSFADELLDMLKAAIKGCQRSPRSHNLLVRVLTFSTSLRSGLNELHGFKPLADINLADYKPFRPGGGTPLCDAAYSAIGAMLDYGRQLADNDFLANGIAFVITDGDDNASSTTAGMIKARLQKAHQDEELESLVTILIGINDASLWQVLESFKKNAGLDKYIRAGDVTAGRLAKLAEYVSQSVSSQSQALGTGGPSQAISTTI
jgi:uncharacterized protein YegL